jgi:hypothetical protein
LDISALTDVAWRARFAVTRYKKRVVDAPAARAEQAAAAEAEALDDGDDGPNDGTAKGFRKV